MVPFISIKTMMIVRSSLPFKRSFCPCCNLELKELLFLSYSDSVTLSLPHHPLFDPYDDRGGLGRRRLQLHRRRPRGPRGRRRPGRGDRGLQRVLRGRGVERGVQVAQLARELPGQPKVIHLYSE